MSFQIKNKDGEAITIRQLDEEAAAFWGKPVKDREYAFPGPEGETLKERMNSPINWFDSIGYQISSPKSDYTSGWANVRCSLWIIYTQWIAKKHSDIEEIKESVVGSVEYMRPYLELIEHWASKGYTPHKVEG